MKTFAVYIHIARPIPGFIHDIKRVYIHVYIRVWTRMILIIIPREIRLLIYTEEAFKTRPILSEILFFNFKQMDVNVFLRRCVVWRMERESLFHANRFNFDWFNWKSSAVSSFGWVSVNALIIIYILRTRDNSIRCCFDRNDKNGTERSMNFILLIIWNFESLEISKRRW